MLRLLFSFLLLSIPCAAQYTTITASNIANTGGNPLSSGQIHFLPTNGKGAPVSARLPSGGQGLVSSVDCTIASGVITGSVNGGVCKLADTSQTNPVNLCYTVTITDNKSGSTQSGPGYQCFQPTGTFTSFDAFIPNNIAIPVQTLVGGTTTVQPSVATGVIASGHFVTEGDSLCNGHGLTGFVAPGYPNATPVTAWPALLGGLPALSGRVAVASTCIDGIGLATMDSDYTANVHPLSPAVTGLPGVLAISIFGNDVALVASEGIAAYETSYASHLARARADGWKIMFLAQWRQAGRQQYDNLRLQFNEYNRENADYYLDTTGRMNDPSNTALYQSDGLHETAEGSREVAQIAQEAILSGGSTSQYGQSVYENATNPFPVTVDASGEDAAIIRNTDAAGYSSALFRDYTGVDQLSVGYSNPSAVFLPGLAFLNTHSSSTALALCVNNTCRFTINTDGSYTFLGVEKANYAALDLHTFQNTAASGYSTALFLDNSGASQLSCGYANPSAVFLPGGAFCNTHSSSTPFSISVGNGVAATFRSDLSTTFYGAIVNPSQKATTGTRYACFDVNGKLVSSATACSGS